MALSRKPAAPPAAPTALGGELPRPKARPAAPPPRIAMIAFLDDASRSMAPWHASRAAFLKRVRDKVREAGGDKVLDLVYVLLVSVSTRVVATTYVALRDAVSPEVELDGSTPLGAGLGRLADETERFFAEAVYPNEVTVRPFRVVVVSDLFPAGETDAETEAGVAKFVAAATKFRAEVTLVGPSAEHTNTALAAVLDVNKAGAQYLDRANPDHLLEWAFDSVLKASRPARPRPAAAE